MKLQLVFVSLVITNIADCSWYRIRAYNPANGKIELAWSWRDDSNFITNNCRVFCNNSMATTRICQQQCFNTDFCQRSCNVVPRNCNNICMNTNSNCRRVCRLDVCTWECNSVTTTVIQPGNCQALCNNLINPDICLRSCIYRQQNCQNTCNVRGQCNTVCGCSVQCSGSNICTRVCPNGQKMLCNNNCNNLGCRLVCRQTQLTTTITTQINCNDRCVGIFCRNPCVTKNCRNVCDTYGRCRYLCGELATTTVLPCRTLCNANNVCRRICGNVRPNCQQLCSVRWCPQICLPTPTIIITTTTAPVTSNPCRLVCDNFGCRRSCEETRGCQEICNYGGCIRSCGSVQNSCRVACNGVTNTVVGAGCRTICRNGGSSFLCGQCSYLNGNCRSTCNLNPNYNCSVSCNRNCRLICDNTLPTTQTNLISRCVDFADRGDCSFYQCFAGRWQCSNNFLITIALPFCLKENSFSNNLDEWSRRYLRKTRICRMRRLMPDVVEATASCSQLNQLTISVTFGNSTGTSCFWLAGDFCRVIRQTNNINALYSMYAGSGTYEKNYVNLFWVLAQRCEKSVCDLFYSLYIRRFNQQYGGITISPITQTVTNEDLCKRYAENSQCHFYTCYDRLNLCSGQNDVVQGAGFEFCRRMDTVVSGLATQAQQYLRDVRRCEMVRVSYMMNTNIQSCSQKNVAARSIFFGSYPEMNCFWQSRRFCDYISVYGNIRVLYSIYGVAGTYELSYYQLFSNLAQRCAQWVNAGFRQFYPRTTSVG